MTDEEFQHLLSSLPGLPFLEDYEEAVSDLSKIATHEQRAKLWEMLRDTAKSPRLTPEQRISRALHSVLGRIIDGADFLDTRELRRVGIGLEYFLPPVLAEIYPYWKGESLDGFYFSEARRIGPEQAELFGACVLISDQTVTPVHIRLWVARSEEKIDRMECRLGKRGTGKGDMERTRWRHDPCIGLPSSKELVDWVYKITFGA
jgi:hypothetical protein